ncbi:serine/threonine-protein kinase [Sphingomonas vulcanisoli]|uniref:Serine/threonine-protein kinase n=1 Tax=Sphingomonas vulcanisoli TaxID=1658060 RepID=A0ABX0TMD5_9SPHN|nr:TIR domain-containing protein [Sphingomonas vulcanisoli]NIJ06683.1 serine/threonine-protein kinase [Sphingomonas vulcanisoli]
MGDIFISYKAEDRARVRPLVDVLIADGFSVWWDAQIEGGASWRQSIQERLDSAKCVIVVWSERSVTAAGHFVHDEASRAQRRGLYLPVRIDPVEPPIGFGEAQAIDLIRWKGGRADPRYQHIADCVRTMIENGPRAAALLPLGYARHPSRRILIMGGGAATFAAAAAAGGWVWYRRGAAPSSNSIAVLPFENLSGDPAQTYFSDGISEELRDTLTSIPSLRVVARTSSDMFRNSRDAATIAARLGVAYVLDGSVRRGADLIRISAQMTEAATGIERWSQSYDRAPGDALSIQSDIANRVAEALQIALGTAGAAKLETGGTRNPQAHDAYLKGVQLLDQVGAEADYRVAIAQFDQAIAVDPSYARAYAARAQAIARMASSFSSAAAATAQYADAQASARHAISLAPDLAQAHLAAGYVQVTQLHVAAAQPYYERAYALGAGDSGILSVYAAFMSRIGRDAAAVAAAERAVSLDPLNPLAFALKAAALGGAGRFPESLAAYRAALKLNPQASFLHGNSGTILYLIGKTDEAAQEFAQEPVGWARATGEGIVAARRKDGAALTRALDFLKTDGGDDFQIAEVLAQSGDHPGALDALERAWVARDGGLVSLRADPLLVPLRSDPRYQRLLSKLGFA